MSWLAPTLFLAGTIALFLGWHVIMHRPRKRERKINRCQARITELEIELGMPLSRSWGRPEDCPSDRSELTLGVTP